MKFRRLENDDETCASFFVVYILGAVRVFLGRQRCGLHVTGGVRACVRAGTLHAIIAGC